MGEAMSQARPCAEASDSFLDEPNAFLAMAETMNQAHPFPETKFLVDGPSASRAMGEKMNQACPCAEASDSLAMGQTLPL